MYKLLLPGLGVVVSVGAAPLAGAQEPVPAQPVPTEPVPAQPVPTEPVPAQPVPTEPVPAQPVPAQPAPAAQPAPMPPPAGYPPATAPPGQPQYAEPPPPYGQPYPYEPPPPPLLQDPTAHLHDGFYLRLSIGGGYLTNTIDTDTGLGELTVKGSTLPIEIMLGGSPTPGFALGVGLWVDPLLDPEVESDVATAAIGDEYTVQFNRFGMFGDWYPDPTEGLHLVGVLAYAAFSVNDEVDSELVANAKGISIGLGVGYEWWIGKQWSAGVLGRFAYASLSADEESHKLLSPSIVATFTLH
jgi:hypothetical protein